MATLVRTIICAVVLLAGAASAEEITLPSDHPYGTLKPGPGSEVAQRSCVLCHSTDYIVTQPPGDANQWDGVVTTMITASGARLSDADAKTITESLARQSGQ